MSANDPKRTLAEHVPTPSNMLVCRVPGLSGGGHVFQAGRYFDVNRAGFSGQEFVKELVARGVRVASSAGPKLIRVATHFDVSRSEIERAGQIIIELAQSRSRNPVASSVTGSRQERSQIIIADR